LTRTNTKPRLFNLSVEDSTIDPGSGKNKVEQVINAVDPIALAPLYLCD
jgi:hypothetical protein